MESQLIKTIKEEQEDGSSQDLSVTDIKIEPVDEELKVMDRGECAIKREMDDAQALLDPLFVPIGVEPHFEGKSEENIKEENVDASGNMEEFSEENSQQHYMECSASSYTQSPSGEVITINNLNQFSESFHSSEQETVHVRKLTRKKPFAVASCSSAYEKPADMSKEPVKPPVTGEGVKQCSDQIEGRSSPSFQREMLESGSLGRPSDEQCFFKCSQCGKELKTRKTLNIHMRIHTGDRPHKCFQCGDSFKESSALTRHRRKHTGERPYICSQCGKSFKENSNLASHMHIHTGHRPYKCSECGKSFSYRGKLTHHMQSHTEDRPHAAWQLFS